MTSRPNQFRKRRLLTLMAVLPWIAGCIEKAQADAADDQQKRFKGIGLVLVVDAVAGAEMDGAAIYDDRGREIYGSAVVSRRVRGIIALGGGRVPLTVRAIWRYNPKPIWGTNGGIDYEGVIAGDYTIPVAERIPDEVLNDIRTHGGGLRLKFRLEPSGVLFGWDIERAAPLGDVSIFEMPGGDFLETRY
jgi:hypothetical protein